MKGRWYSWARSRRRAGVPMRGSGPSCTARKEATVRRSREASVGFVILLAGVVLLVGILAVGKESKLFTRKTEYWTSFPNVMGLAEGSPVKLVGVQVGTVGRVDFPSDLADR